MLFLSDSNVNIRHYTDRLHSFKKKGDNILKKKL